MSSRFPRMSDGDMPTHVFRGHFESDDPSDLLVIDAEFWVYYFGKEPYFMLIVNAIWKAHRVSNDAVPGRFTFEVDIREPRSLTNGLVGHSRELSLEFKDFEPDAGGKSGAITLLCAELPDNGDWTMKGRVWSKDVMEAIESFESRLAE